jgi:hypothetical protein
MPQVDEHLVELNGIWGIQLEWRLKQKQVVWALDSDKKKH